MIVEFLQQDGFQPKRKGPSEFSSPCPACGGNDRFITKTDSGRYFCRQCGIKGDSIEYLRSFRSMTYRQAAELVGKDISSLPGKRNGHRTPAAPHKSTVATITPPPEQWAANADALVREAGKALIEDPVILAWLLEARGITQGTAEQFRLGWIYRNLYASRAAWGLPEQLGADGKTKKLFLPSGLLIPGPDRLRIRRDDPGEYGKYYVLPGSGNAPMIINGHLATDSAAAIIVESELDGILLAQQLKTSCMIVATGSTSNGPTEELIENLRRRPFVLIALDSDQAGGKAAWGKWMAVLPNSCRAPVPTAWGKDHGEAYKNGHDLNVWFSAARGFAPSSHPANPVRAAELAPLGPEPVPDVIDLPNEGEPLGATPEWCQGSRCASYCRTDMSGLDVVEGCNQETDTKHWLWLRLDKMNSCPRGKE
jgi:5S rRNA maturation endonuclease (ribonuclease M5)